MNKIRESSGDFSINGAFIMVLVFALLVLIISVFGVVNQAIRVHTMAAELTRYIELRGQIDAPVYAELSRLENLSGIDAGCEIQATYLNGSTRVQFGEAFTVRLSYTARFGIGGVVSVPIPLHSTVSGRSELFWK